MIATIRRLLAPPIFPEDEIKTNAAYTLHLTLLIMTVFTLSTALYFAFQETNRLRNLTIISVSILLLIIKFYMLRQGYVYSAGRLYLSYMWILPIGLSLATRGILSPYPMLHLIVILLASIVLHPNYSAFFAVLSILSSVFLLIVSKDLPEIATVVDNSDYQIMAISNWFIYTSCFTITAILIMYSSRMINNIFERLIISEDRYRITAELISDYAYAYTVLPNNKIEHEWSTPHSLEQVTGYTSEELLERPLFNIFHPEDIKHAKQDVQRIKKGESFTSEYRIKTKDDQIRWLEVTRQPVWDKKENRVIRYYGAASDITDRKLAKQHALEVAEVQGRVDFFRDFVSNMTHDLKTPLAIINTSIYLLSKSTEPAHQEKHLTKLQNQADQLTKKIDAILTIAHLDSIPELTLDVVDVNAMMTRICDQFNSHLEHNTLKLHTNFEDSLPSLLGDVDELHRALTNLVENAINYTPENGSIYLDTTSTPNHIIIEVRDTGIGISTDDLERIFDRFFRADNAKSYQGTGLGLAILQRIITLHKGTIEVDSTVGEGTTFKLIFPRPQ